MLGVFGEFDSVVAFTGCNDSLLASIIASMRFGSTRVISSWNGTILVGAEDQHLYAVAPDGTLLWLLDFGGDIDTTPAIARDGTIYVAGDDGLLHAFR